MNKTSKPLVKSFFVNLFLSIIKIVVGTIGKSSSLIADGIHSFSDLATDFVAIFGSCYSLKPADKEHPYGHGRLEYLTSLVIGIVIIVLGLNIIFKTSFDEIIIPSKIVIVVSIFTIISKLIISKYLLKKGYEYNNVILISSGKESSMDVISSIFVLLASILMQFSNTYSFLKYSNFIATIIIGLFIIKTGILILKDNISSIIGEQEVEKKEELIKLISLNPNIVKTDDLVVIKNGPYFQVIGEVSMNENMTLKKVHDIVDELEEKIKEYDNRFMYINIHVNPTKDK